MVDLQDAANHIISLASKYEPLMRVAQLLKEVGSVEAHLAELTARRASALAEQEKEDAAHVVALEAKAVELAAAESRVMAFNGQAARLESETHRRIQELFVAAEAEAVDKAELVYQTKMAACADLDREYATKSEALEALRHDVSALEAEKIRVSEETTAAQAGLSEVIHTIERLSKFGSVA